MRILKDVGLVKTLLVVAALLAANLYVGARTTSLEAQQSDPCRNGPDFCEGQDLKCTFPVPLPGNYCDFYPTSSCSLATCTETALEP